MSPSPGEDAADVRAENTGDLFLKCCETTKLKIVVCAYCGSAFHRSCYGKSIKPGDARIKCNECVKNSRDGKNLTPTPTTAAVNMLEFELMRKENEYLKRELNILNKSMENLEELVQMQKEMLRSSDKQQPGVASTTMITSYSQVVKQIPKTNTRTFFVKSADTVNTEIEKDIKKQINPGTLRIQDTKLIRNGLLITCEQAMGDKLKQELERKTGAKYNIQESTKFNPRLMVFGVDNTATRDENFIQNIITANDLPNDVNDIKIIKVFEKRTRTGENEDNPNFKARTTATSNVILEMKPASFNKINGNGYIYAGWRRCKVQENINLKQCFKCSNIGHVSTYCRSEKLKCNKCSGEHETRTCKSEAFSCANCLLYNAKAKTKVPTNHMATDKDCPHYRFHLQRLKNMINYDEN